MCLPVFWTPSIDNHNNKTFLFAICIWLAFFLIDSNCIYIYYFDHFAIIQSMNLKKVKKTQTNQLHTPNTLNTFTHNSIWGSLLTANLSFDGVKVTRIQYRSLQDTFSHLVNIGHLHCIEYIYAIFAPSSQRCDSTHFLKVSFKRWRRREEREKKNHLICNIATQLEPKSSIQIVAPIIAICNASKPNVWRRTRQTNTPRCDVINSMYIYIYLYETYNHNKNGNPIF